VFELRVALLNKAALASDVALFKTHASAVLARLERDSGLVAYRELSELPPQERLTRALGLAHERYLATPEHELLLFGEVDGQPRLAAALVLEGMDAARMQPDRSLQRELADQLLGHRDVEGIALTLEAETRTE
jgi:hypothetical protein